MRAFCNFLQKPWLVYINFRLNLGENVMIEDQNEKTNVRQLTHRELEVLKHLITGKSNTQIAKDLDISAHTIKAHVCSILHKMSVKDRVQAAVKAVREQIVD